MPHVEPTSWAWPPHEIFVRVVEDPADDGSFSTRPYQPEAGVYAPSFDLWEGSTLLDFLFAADAKPEEKSGPALRLLLNLRLPKEAGTQFPH